MFGSVLHARRSAALLGTTLPLALVVALVPATTAWATAPAVVRVVQTRLEFGKVTVGTDSRDQGVTLRNEGPGAASGLTLSPIRTFDGSATPFRRTATTCGSTLS